MILGAYTIGFKQAKSIYKDNIIPESINPLKTAINASKKYKQDKEAEAKEKEYKESVGSILSYDGDTALEAIKKERR